MELLGISSDSDKQNVQPKDVCKTKKKNQWV